MRRELAAKIILATLLVLFLINFTGAHTYKLSAFEIEVDTKLSTNPSTVIKFPPVGRVRANTHKAPLDIFISLEALHQERLSYILENIEDKEELVDVLGERTKVIVQLHLIRLFIISLLGGLVGASLVKYDKEAIITGLLVGIIIITTFSALAYYSYDINEFSDPSFEGMLEAAPWMIALIEEGLENIENLGYEIELIASSIADLFSKVGTLKPLARVGGDLRVLHLSDIHNNPVALPFIKQIAHSFEVDLIIDTGDMTDYGTPIEGELVEDIDELGIPYIFIGGNHDSPQIVERMKGFENVIVLEEGVVEIGGLTIVGVEDPSAKSNEMRVKRGEEIREDKEKLAGMVKGLEKDPDIVIVHNSILAEDILGEIPLLLHGHYHNLRVYEEKGTLIIDAGTTGASGLRGLQTREGIPYSVVLLHYNKEEDQTLSLDTLDLIKFYDRHSGFILERKLVN
ncbi:metallophosphoesterase family protein [Halonatronum saccharophilum]|uniref:metallophosphoesterase family protein n=1 Tax=Halonatronum saccharophilum TaxID=150060 RepID=UPI00047F706B|nr:metallophosphoesterase [Halonatronum saccharophilum]